MAGLVVVDKPSGRYAGGLDEGWDDGRLRLLDFCFLSYSFSHSIFLFLSSISFYKTASGDRHLVLVSRDQTIAGCRLPVNDTFDDDLMMNLLFLSSLFLPMRT